MFERKKLDIPKIELERAVASSSNDGSTEIVFTLVDQYCWKSDNAQSILLVHDIKPNAHCMCCGDSANHFYM
jgi:hypothetical protein